MNPARNSNPDRAVALPPRAALSRRTFIKVGAAAGGGLLLGLGLGGVHDAAAAESGGFTPDAFIRIDRDGRVTFVVCQVEMGQGTYTSMSMLIAEELEVELASVHVEHAPASDKLYANPLLGFQATGGSTSVRGFWEPLRRAGATARTMLIAAAADNWKTDRKHLSRRARRGDPRTDGAQARIWCARRQGGHADGAGQGRPQGPARVQADRDARQAPRHPGQGQWQGGIRHRTSSFRG